jgi:hypothetical protein
MINGYKLIQEKHIVKKNNILFILAILFLTSCEKIPQPNNDIEEIFLLGFDAFTRLLIEGDPQLVDSGLYIIGKISNKKIARYNIITDSLITSPIQIVNSLGQTKLDYSFITATTFNKFPSMKNIPYQLHIKYTDVFYSKIKSDKFCFYVIETNLIAHNLRVNINYEVKFQQNSKNKWIFKKIREL